MDRGSKKFRLTAFVFFCGAAFATPTAVLPARAGALAGGPSAAGSCSHLVTRIGGDPWGSVSGGSLDCGGGPQTRCAL